VNPADPLRPAAGRALRPDPIPDDGASALSAVPAAGSRRGMSVSGSVKFFYGPMDCGSRRWHSSWTTTIPGRAAADSC